MRRIFLLTKNAFRAMLHARSLYLWLLAAVLISLSMVLLILIHNPRVPAWLNPAMHARLAELIRNRRPNTLAAGLNDWSLLCIVFGILVGATAVSKEINTKTIITTLARPVERWELLFGKWMAIQLFAIASLAIGLALFEAAAAYLHVPLSGVVWMALAHALVATLLYSGIAIALSTVLSPTLSGAIAVLAAFLPGLISFLLEDTARYRHAVGVALDYIVPPGYSNLYTMAVRAGAVLDYSVQYKTLLENLGYGVLVFVLGCVIFTKREIQLG